MATLNLCQFIGNVGKIETRYTPSGDAICNISLAVNESWKDKTTGDKKERAEWVRVVFFGKVAEITAQYVKVGHPIYVSGKLATRKWADKDGKDQYTTEIRADQLQMLKQGRDDESQDAPPKQSSSGGQRDQRPGPAANYEQSGGGFDDFASDIPFAPIGQRMKAYAI